MKQHAQAILLLTGHPLEPIVALEIKKSLQSDQVRSFQKAATAIAGFTYQKDETAEAWFNNYE